MQQSKRDGGNDPRTTRVAGQLRSLAGPWTDRSIRQRAIVLGALCEGMALLMLVLMALDVPIPANYVLYALLSGPLIAMAYYATQHARKVLIDEVHRLGLHFSAKDPFNLRALPLPAFRRSGEHRIEWVGSGEWLGLQVFLFGYRHRPVLEKTEDRFTCLIIKQPFWAPALEIRREDAGSRLAGAIGIDDVQFESGAFNDTFRVTSDDKRFAYALVDQRMMDWLAVAPTYGFQVAGNAVMVIAPTMAPRDLEPFMGRAKEFVDQIPRAVRSMYRAEPSVTRWDG
ncbi:MAG: hypothetical protein WD004_08755 [Actinomycetota bacterium]